jgi:hypothetical protein
LLGLDCIHRILPVEILEKVFRFLPPRDLMIALRVCTRWREIGENPALWTFFKLKIVRRGQLCILDIRRLQFLQEIVVDGYSWKPRELVELFLALGKVSNLRKIAVKRYDTNYMEKVFSSQTPKPKPLEILFATISRASKLKNLCVPGICLSFLDPAYFAKTLSNIEEINISYCGLNTLQAETILSYITASSKLKDLYIGYNKLTDVKPIILARAVRELARIDLGNTRLTTLQIETMFKALNKESKLKWMSIVNNDLSMVDQNLLVETRFQLRTSDQFLF